MRTNAYFMCHFREGGVWQGGTLRVGPTNPQPPFVPSLAPTALSSSSSSSSAAAQAWVGHEQGGFRSGPHAPTYTRTHLRNSHVCNKPSEPYAYFCQFEPYAYIRFSRIKHPWKFCISPVGLLLHFAMIFFWNKDSTPNSTTI